MRKAIRRRVCAVMLAAWGAVCAIAFPALGQGGLDIVPASAQGLITIENMSRLHSVLGVDALRQAHPEQFHGAESEMIGALGFSLLDLDGVRRFGLDPDRPVYLAISLDPAFSLALLLPGGESAQSALHDLIESEDLGSIRRTEHEGAEITVDQDDEVALFSSGEYLVVVVVDPNEDDASAERAAKSFVEHSNEKSIAEDDRFQRLYEKLPGGFDVTFYLGPNLWRGIVEFGESDACARRGVSADETLELYEKWKLTRAATVFRAKIESDRLTVEGYSWVGKDSELMKWYGVGNDPMPFLKRVPSDPMLVAMARFNSAAFWHSVEEALGVFESDSLPPIDESIGKVSDDVGLDIEDELVEQIDGNFGLLVNSAGLTGADAVFLAQLSDPERFDVSLTQFAEWMEEEIAKDAARADSTMRPRPPVYLTEEDLDGQRFYMLRTQGADICFGVVEDHLVMTSSRRRFRAVVEGDGSFVDMVGNDQIRAALGEREGSVFYIDFRSLSRDLGPILTMFGPDSDELLGVLEELSELVSTTLWDDEGSRQVLTLTGTKPDMWERLIGLGLEKAAENARRKAADPGTVEDIEPQ